MDKITAKKSSILLNRICLGDVFKDVDVVENIELIGSEILIETINFPMVVCLNQECDLEQDFYEEDRKKTKALMHLIVSPVFNFEDFMRNKHWGDIYNPSESLSPKGKGKVEYIKDNEIPRYHFLKFDTKDNIPDLVVDFKSFFTVNRNYLYKNLKNRKFSIDNLFKENLSQRFSFYLSRIGLP